MLKAIHSISDSCILYLWIMLYVFDLVWLEAFAFMYLHKVCLEPETEYVSFHFPQTCGCLLQPRNLVYLIPQIFVCRRITVLCNYAWLSSEPCLTCIFLIKHKPIFIWRWRSDGAHGGKSTGRSNETALETDRARDVPCVPVSF